MCEKAAGGESCGQSTLKGGLGRPQGRRRARRRSRGAGRGVTPAPKMQPDGDGFAMFREMGYNKIRKQSEKFRQENGRTPENAGGETV